MPNLMRIAVPIIGPTEDSALRDLDEAEKQGVDIVEIRRDYFTGSVNIERLLKHKGIPKIFTVRHKSQAGPDVRAGYNRNEEERIDLFKEAISLGVEYIDREFSNFLLNGFDLGKTRGIISDHDFQITKGLGYLIDKVNSMHKLSPGDIIKIVTRSNKSRDNLVMLSLIHTCADYEMIGICMGKEGVETRITGPNYGSYLTFACLDGRPSAPGQISIGKLKKIWKDVYGYEGKQV